MASFKHAQVGEKKIDVVLVPREQLRLHNPPRFQRRSGVHITAPLPIHFPMDWSKNRSITYPILGNNRYGDCYLVAIVHWIQGWTGLLGSEWQPAEQSVIDHYLELSGGDNGLSDNQVYPDWKRGELPPDRPHKLLDYAALDVHDDLAINESLYAGCGIIWTAALEDTWLNNTRPGSIWDAGGRPDPNAGHAMYISGTASESGNLVVETWAISPPIQVTRAGMRQADPELVACVSLDMFDSHGKTASGLTYQEVSDWWSARTGRTLPPWPGPGPGPGPGPNPGPAWLCTIIDLSFGMIESRLGNQPILLAMVRWLHGVLAADAGCGPVHATPPKRTAAELGQLQQQFDAAMQAAIAQAGPGTLVGLFLMSIQAYVDGLFAPPAPPPTR